MGDKDLCLVLAIRGNFLEGGELALKGPGLVIDLGNGGFAAFRLDRTTRYKS